MAQEFKHRLNTPESHLLITKIQDLLGYSGTDMCRALGIFSPSSWQYLKHGAKIQPYIIERLICMMTLEQIAALRADIMQHLNTGA